MGRDVSENPETGRGLVPKSGREAKQRRLDFGDGPAGALTLSQGRAEGASVEERHVRSTR